MKTKILSLFVALIATTAIWASNTITYTATEKLSGYNGSLDVGKTTFGPAITSHTFSNGQGTITCSGEVTTIGAHAFQYCEGLTSITIPNSVTTIGAAAFNACSSLTLVTIGNSVTTIGENAFFRCSGLKKTNYTGTIASWCKIKFSGKTSNPICYSENFFINDVEVKDLVIPEGIEAIGDYAFSGCTGLTSITIPNSVTTIGSHAFNGCSSLTSVTIPNSVTTIGDCAFQYCSGLTSVTIPNSVTTIGNGAFYECSGLTSVTIPNSVTTIGNYAFYSCSNKNLKEIALPNSVETIGKYAFAECSYLKTITLGAKLEDIDEYAFLNDERLYFVNCYAEEPPILQENAFDNYDIYLQVPCDVLNEYKVAKGWKLFNKENVSCISAEEKPITGDEVTVDPSADNVTITWPANDNASEYKLVITKDGIVFCTLTFNAQGQLIGIAFAPNRDGSRMLDAAVMTSNGWQFTVTGLDQACKYGYTIDALNASKQSIKHYEGEFATDGYTSLEWVISDKIQGINKMLLDGHLYILRDGNLFTATGAKVK